MTEASVGDRDVSIDCEISAKPSITEVLWIIDANGTVLKEGEQTHNYMAVYAVSQLQNNIIFPAWTAILITVSHWRRPMDRVPELGYHHFNMPTWSDLCVWSGAS